MLSIEMIEYLHDNGQMPDWAYYQQNNKPAYYNHSQQINKFLEREKLSKQLENELQEQLEDKLAKALDNLFSGFKKQ